GTSVPLTGNRRQLLLAISSTATGLEADVMPAARVVSAMGHSVRLVEEGDGAGSGGLLLGQLVLWGRGCAARLDRCRRVSRVRLRGGVELLALRRDHGECRVAGRLAVGDGLRDQLLVAGLAQRVERGDALALGRGTGA